MLSLNNLSPKSQEDFKIKFSNRNALLAILLLILFFVYTINVVVDLMIYYDIFNYQYGNIFILISFIGFTLLGLLPTTLYIIKIKFPTNYKILNGISIASCFIMFLIGGLCTLLNLANSNDITFYTMIILIIGFLIVLDKKIVLPLFLVNYAFYIFILLEFSNTNIYSFTKILNTTLITLLSLAFSIVNYQLKIREFINIDTILMQNEQLKMLSMKDSLTSLYNRRYFDKCIVSLIDVCILTREQFSVMMIDIDNFKTINDTYGHQIGDECIKAVSSTIINNCNKSNGLGFRYGGEEFTLLFLKHNEQAVLNIAESIRETIEMIKIKNTDIKLTVSIGVYHTYADENTDFAYCVKTADNLLYSVKKLGKNKVLLKVD